MDALVRRRDRKRRNRRVGSAVVALVMVGAVAVALGEAFLAGKGKPAYEPTPSPSATVASTTGAVVVGLDGTVRAHLPNIPSYASSLVMAPDGRTIAFSTGSRIGVVGIDGTHLRFLTRLFSRSDGPGAGNISFLSWSTDGSRIAFILNRGFGGQVSVVDADGSHLARLTFDDEQDEWPSWSPEGSTIVYANSCITFAPRWSPDGTRIAVLTYYARHPAADGSALLTIHVVDLSTGTVTRIPGLVATISNAVSWLPSG